MVRLYSELIALKVGITTGEDRLAAHRQQGWQLVVTYPPPTAADAAYVEAQVIEGWRAAGWPQAVEAEQMPQGGCTETVSMAHMDAPTARRQMEAALAAERLRSARAAA